MVAARDSQNLFAHDLRPIPQTSISPLEENDLFQATMQSLRRRLSLFVWQGFFEPLYAVSYSNQTLTIAAPSSFHRDWIQDHYIAEISDAAGSIAGHPVRVLLIQGDQNIHVSRTVLPEPLSETPIVPLRAPTITVPLEEQNVSPLLETSRLNPDYTFDAFIAGPSNQMAFAACSAVAEQPGNQYSPLFLFGPVGLGKTHLLHAIGSAAQSKRSGFRVLYMSAEQWVNAYVQSIREKRFDAFRKKFRSSCDMLLIDDIQFLVGKDASQDEFFHTFNALHQAHKQIVMTSDRYPHEIEGLEDRLKTRLSWGLIADIRPPEFETRLAILHRKAENCQIALPNDVAHYLASQITNSVRELEGALVRLSAFSTVTKTQLTLAQAKDYLSPVFRRGIQGQISPDKVCDIVANYYDLKPEDLKGMARQRQIAVARQVSMSLCRTYLAMSLPEIGRFFGNRDHTTVLASIRKMDEMRDKDIGIQSVMSKLEKILLDQPA